MSAPLRVGVVGTGSLGYHHARILRDLPGVAFKGFFEANAERAGTVSRELGIRAYPTLDALIADVDALSIVVPTSKHHEVAMTALNAGKHLLIEKPITATLKEADELLALAEKKKAMIQIGHIERFNRAIRAALPYVDKPLFIDSDRLAPFNPRGSDVAVVLDLMIHDIDIILSLVPAEVAEVRASGVPVLTDSVDIANARIEFTDGCVANVTASRVSAKSMRKLRVFQPDTYVSIDFESRECAVARKLPGEGRDGMPKIDHQLRRFAQGDSLEAELRAFVDAVRGRARPGATGREGRRALDLALAVSHRIRAGLK